METSKIKVTLRSLLFSYLLSGLLLIVISFALYKLRLKESQVRTGVNLVYVLSCFLGGFLMGKGCKERRFFWGLLLGMLYSIILFAVSILLNKGFASTPAQFFTTMGICVVSGILGGILS
ncbi:MAG: TIGR04086 family membrane protein [Hungatella sp.]